MRPRPAGLTSTPLLPLPLVLLALAGLGCGTGLPRPTAPAVAVPPWRIPSHEFGTQRLFRVHYEGPEGEGSFRLTLRLAAPERYRLSAVDLLGRSLWSLSAEGEEGLWLDYRAEHFCRFTGRLDLTPVPLSPFTLPSLPAVLLGRLPVAPAGRTATAAGGRLEYQDADGRLWRLRLEAGWVRSWTLFEAGEPVAWWSRRGDEAVLSERRGRVQIRWRQAVREPLAELPPPPAVPAGFGEWCRWASDAG